VRQFIKFVIYMSLGIALGLGSAWYVLDNGLSIDAVDVGAWTVRTEAGQPIADPYTSAYVARIGHIPLKIEEAIYFFANADDEGRELDGACTYALTGSNLRSAWWSISAHTPDGELIPSPARRYSYTQAAMLFDEDQIYRLTVSPEAQPGNWLPTSGTGPIFLVLRLHGPAPDHIRAPETVPVPAIEREGCRS
jgi:hypothetical protein